MNILLSALLLVLTSTSAVSAESIRGVDAFHVPTSGDEEVSSTSFRQSSSSSTGCHNFRINMKQTWEQKYSGNPDKGASAYAECRLCADGDQSMTCSNVVVNKGRFSSYPTEVIACHIHIAPNGDGRKEDGPPVINFCGNNHPIDIDDKKKYKGPPGHLAKCHDYGDTFHMEGNGPVPGSYKNHGNLKHIIQDIHRNPGSYYMNFHSKASFENTSTSGKGICRGVVELVPNEFGDEFDDLLQEE